MKCPRDGTEMLTSLRHDVEIDHCPKCRGVWLDRGELDKIIAGAVAPLVMEEPPAPPATEWREPARPGDTPVWREPERDRPREWREPERREEGSRGKRYTRRKHYRNWLEEIFDLD